MKTNPRSTWPFGFLGMVVLVAIVESTLASHPLRFVETASLSWRLAVEAIPQEAERCEVACLGDSLVKIGVIPEVVRETLGRNTYNFAMAQAPPPATYFVLRRLLEAGGKPSAIVVDFKPSLLAGGPKFSIRHWQTVLSGREACELAFDSKSPSMLCEIALGRLLPSYRDRVEIRQAIVSGLKGEVASNLVTNRLALRNWSVNRGAHVNSPRIQFHGEVGPDIHRKLLSDDWKPHRINALYVDRILSLAGSMQIPVYWVIPPLPTELQRRREASGVDAAYVQFVESMQDRHPGVTVVDGRASGYDASTFADHTHLNGRGSITFSQDLGEILAGRHESNDWVALPRYRDVSSMASIEDIEETRIVVEIGPPRRTTLPTLRAN